jgi:chaperonin GroEL
MNDLVFDDEGRGKLIDGITKISKAVKSTLGPRGKTVLIESQNHVHGITVTKDGVTVARSINLKDPVENLAVRMMKEAADRTATSAGDGTTTSVVITEAIVNKGSEFITSKNNPTEVLRNVNTVVDGVVKRLEGMSKRVSGRTLRDVAAISANNDRELGSIIADAYKKVGRDGIVTVERSQTDATYSEVTNGIRVERGYTSRLFVNDMKKDECVMDDVYVMVSDQEISNILSIENVLKPVINGGKKLLIIAPCTQNVINTLAANVVQNSLKFCNIQPPQFGYKQHELMQDIALALGATYFSEQTGDDLSLIGMEHLGRAERIIVGRDSTVIVRAEHTSDAVKERVEQLWVQHNNSSKKSERDAIKERIASLTGGVGVIYVGGGSDVEQKERYDRVDDAVCAVRSALEEGILPGGGVALFNIASDIIAYADDNMEHISHDEYTAMQIVGWAMQTPLLQIMSNAGLDGYEVMSSVRQDGHGYDLKNERYGDMFEMGVIDPLKVTKNALKNAVSVATTILSTNAIVTLTRV